MISPAVCIGMGMMCAGLADSQAVNPTVWADVPDASMIRVADAYYMTSTTMHMSPGLPIMKSTDLINWHLVSYAYETLGNEDALCLQNGRNAYGQGSWASSLRYHNGLFYATTFASTTGKTHIFTTPDIEHGPWKETSFRPAFHDHSLVFEEDGRVYMVHGAGNVRLTELNSDLSGIKPGGVDQAIIEDASKVAGPNVGLRAEGSQLFKINGKYYLFMITWPRGGMRTALVFRSNSLLGPYEGRVALQDMGVAQGGLIDTSKGEWYAYLFQDHGAVGRTPFLVPVRWVDGWPVLGEDGKAPMQLKMGVRNDAVPAIVASDEFQRKPGDPALPLQWQWNHNPDNAHWSVTERPGFLRLTTGRVDPGLLTARNTLTQRTFGPTCRGEVALDISGLHDGDCAGLAVLQQKFGFVGVRAENGKRSLVMVSAETGAEVEAQRLDLEQTKVWLRIDCDFQSRKDRASFFYSLDGKSWKPLGTSLKMAYTLPHFMGYRYALFCYSTKAAGGHADFDWFHIDAIHDEK